MHIFQDPLFLALRKRKHKKQKTEKKRKIKPLMKSYCLVEKPGSVLRRKVRFGSTKKIHANRICQSQSYLSLTAITPTKCPKCNLVFHSRKKWNLERHLQLHSSYIKKYECSLCSRSYSTKHNFKKHLPRRHQSQDSSTITWTITYEKSRVRPTFPENYT